MGSTNDVIFSGDYVKRIVFKDAAKRAKSTSISDAKDCWEIVCGTETEPVAVHVFHMTN